MRAYLLRRGELLPAEKAAGWRIECAHGVLLVSQYDDMRDHVLLAGESFIVRTNRLVLVEACAESALHLHPVTGPLARLWQRIGLTLLTALGGM